jgi:hypothetical protein
MSGEPLPEDAAIVPSHSLTLIEPAAEIDELKNHWEKIQQLKKSILDKSDISTIQNRTFVKRSGWRKMAAAFAISDRIAAQQREDLGNGEFLWRLEVEAYHRPSGRSMTGVAACSSKERKFAHPEHDVYATAHTRAKNRAISDLIGLGEVSAEEIDSSEHDSPLHPDTRPMTEDERLAREKAKAMGQKEGRG